MSFDVLGSYRGVAYTLTVGETAADLAGSPAIVGALRSWAGQTVMATPTGPQFVVDLDDPVTVWAALTGRTRVTSTSGEVPVLVPPGDLTGVH